MKRKLSPIFTILTVLSLLCACGPTTAETQGTDVQQTDTAAGSAAAELVADIPTTQYFSDDPVADEDIEKILYAGDGDTDMQFAAKAGFLSVGCAWGYRERAQLEQAGARYVVDTVGALARLLGMDIAQA